jgi:Zn-dependent M16 (insulinase) family peptidase
MTLKDCQKYYQEHYHPGNMTIIVAGDAVPQAARGLVEQYFGDIPNPGLPPAPRVVEPRQRGERRLVLKKVSQVEALFAGFHIVGMDHPDIYPLNLLSVIMSGGKSSRFYQEFVRPGKAVEVSVEMASPPLGGPGPGSAGHRGYRCAGAIPGGIGRGRLGRDEPPVHGRGEPGGIGPG